MKINDENSPVSSFPLLHSHPSLDQLCFINAGSELTFSTHVLRSTEGPAPKDFPSLSPLPKGSILYYFPSLPSSFLSFFHLKNTLKPWCPGDRLIRHSDRPSYYKRTKCVYVGVCVGVCACVCVLFTGYKENLQKAKQSSQKTLIWNLNINTRKRSCHDARESRRWRARRRPRGTARGEKGTQPPWRPGTL